MALSCSLPCSSRLGFASTPTKSPVFLTHQSTTPFLGLKSFSSDSFALIQAASRSRISHLQNFSAKAAEFDARSVFESPNQDQQNEQIQQDLKSSWKEIQGANNWEGLISPLDGRLRKEIIRYGEFAQACYDSFEYNKHSRFCGSCKYNKDRLFAKVGLAKTGYEITKYLYATSDLRDPSDGLFRSPENLQTPWSKDSNWIGYVAVSTAEDKIETLGRRDIVIVWRGTVVGLDWLINKKHNLSLDNIDGRKSSSGCEIKVQKGLYHLYTSKKGSSRFNRISAREQLLWEIHRLMDKYKDEELSITVAGHSLGGALALLSAYDIAESGLNKKCKMVLSSAYREEKVEKSDRLNSIFEPVLTETGDDDKVPITVFSYAAPKLGNDGFNHRCEELGLKVLRTINNEDIVPKSPGIGHEKLPKTKEKLPLTYAHLGTEIVLSHDMSPFLQPSKDPLFQHNLEAHLHLIDGFHGINEPFQSSFNRDLALVNKASDLLKREYKVPPFWWQDQNKGLVKNKLGRWVQFERDPEDMPR